MKLLFDIGNSRLKWAIARAGQLVSSGAEDADRVDGDLLSELFATVDRPTSVWVSNVGTEKKLDVLLSWLEMRYELVASVVQVNGSACGIQNGYHDLASLGVDRWVAALGARSINPVGDIIIIDAGTAVTIDWLSAKNIFEGGVILPGLVLMHDALVTRTAGIQSDYFDTQQIIGKTTQECVNSGVVFGLSGAVERVVDEMQKTIGKPANIILTGGGAGTLIDKMRLVASCEPDLVLYGLLKFASQIYTKDSC